MKPGLCRFFCRVLHPLTRSCFLLLSLGRLSLFALPFLLGIRLPSLCSPPFSFHASALIPLSLAKVQLLLTLTLSHLTIWYYAQTALFLFFLAKAVLAYLPTALSVGLRSLSPFWQAQYDQVFPLKSLPFCKFFAGVGSTNKSATSLLLLSDSRFALATLSSPLSFLLPQYLRQIWQELSSLSSCSIRLQWVPGHSLLPRNAAADELATWGAPLVPSAIPCSLSPLISHIHSSLFSDWGHTVLSKFFNT